MNNKLIFAAVLIAAATVGATPTPYPLDQSELFKISNPTTSGLIADDTESRKVHVLPPNVAEATVKGLHTLSANVGFCAEMKELQSYSLVTVKQMNDLIEERIAHKSVADEAHKVLQKARMEAAALATDKRVEFLVNLTDQIDSMEARLTELYKLKESCTKTCGELKVEIANTEDARDSALDDRSQFQKENAKALKEYNKKKAVADAAAEVYRDAYATFNQLKTDLAAIRTEYLEMYRLFGQMEGGRAAINYESNWDSNIQTLRKLNPGFQFEKIQTENAKLFANIISVKDLPSDMAVVGYEMAGTQKDNYLQLPSGFPAAISGNLRLSLVGACPMLHPEAFDIEPGYGADKMAYGITITYDFPAAFKLKAVAKYNMYKMYSKVVSSGSSGGFFSSRSWSNVEERTFFKDSFNVDWTSQDPQNEISEERRLQTEHEMRAHIMERIAGLALPTAPNQGQMIAPGAPPPRGATVVAGSLMQACPGNVYCVAGSLILTSLDAIFGSSSATASYMQTQDFESTETWTQSKVIMKPWVTTFIPRK